MNNSLLKISLIFNACFLILMVYVLIKYPKETRMEISKETQKINVVLFGDSRVAEVDWNALLDRKDVKNAGFRGFTSSHLRWILKENVLDLDPKICFISVGINDLGAGIPLERIKLNFRVLIDKLKGESITPVIQSVICQENNPKNNVMVDSLNAYLKSYCTLKSIHYLDINSKFSSVDGLKPEFSRDGTHLKASANVIWAEEIKDLLKALEH